MIKKLDDDLIRLNRLDWDKCKAFYYVAKFGKILSASRHINISYPALSKKISLLEQELGCKLFTRNSNGVTLTSKGQRLFEISEKTFLDLKEFTHDMANLLDNDQKRKIRIATTHAIASYVIGRHLLTYSQLNPHVVFEVITEDQMIDVILNEVDLVIRPDDKVISGMKHEHLFTLEKKLYASHQYLEQYGEPKTVEDLRNHHVISHAQPEKHPYSDLNWILKVGMPDDQMREPVFASSSLENAVEAAKLGLGIIGSYSEMSIIHQSGLQRILSNIQGPIVKDYIMYPEYLKSDKNFISFKNYLLKINLHS